MEFKGVLKEEHENSRGQLKKKWNFHGSWFLTLGFPRGVTHNFAEFLGVQACFPWNFYG